MKLGNLFSNRNIFILSTLLFVVWIVFFDRNNLLDSTALDQRIEELEQERTYYLEKIRQDSAVIAGLKDSAFLERYAREHFLMHRPGEEVYLIDEAPLAE